MVDDLDVAAVIVGRVALQRSSIATFQSKEGATANAAAHCPELPWGKIFDALEAAGILAFLDQE